MEFQFTYGKTSVLEGLIFGQEKWDGVCVCGEEFKQPMDNSREENGQISPSTLTGSRSAIVFCQRPSWPAEHNDYCQQSPAVIECKKKPASVETTLQVVMGPCATYTYAPYTGSDFPTENV